MPEINSTNSPFVGLRPFESTESELFFGREEQIRSLLNKLHETRFVAVVGSSGSGKSSLVKAGLIPALKAGFLNSNDHWYISSFRPGNRPMYYLAKGLKKTFSLTSEVDAIEKDIQLEGVDAILEAVQPLLNEKKSNFLILVDQFEELFTHFSDDQEQSSNIFRTEFVKILLELLQTKLPIYIIITMRSDFIGRCNIFYGLPEVISNSQFLVPRLENRELTKVIEGPIKLFGSNLDPVITHRILNDLKDGEDQLPVLEHGLSQLWKQKKENSPLTITDYESTGTLERALSKHANSIYNALVSKQPDLERKIPEMFKYLIDFDGERKEGVRQPRKVHEIMKVTGASFDDIRSIYESFSAEGASFLFSQSGKTLHENSSIDISHESLMREWKDFKRWRDIEEQDKITLEKLTGFAREYNNGKKEALRGPELASYSEWKKYLDFKKPENKKNILNWANRYKKGDFPAVNDYLEKSNRKKVLRRYRVGSFVLLVIALATYGAFSERQRLKSVNEVLVERHLTDSLRKESLKRDSIIDAQKAIEAVIRLEIEKEKSRTLGSTSETKTKLYLMGEENQKLEGQIAILNRTNAQQEETIQLLSNKTYSSDKRFQDLVAQNQLLLQERDRANKSYVTSQAQNDSLKFRIQLLTKEQKNPPKAAKTTTTVTLFYDAMQGSVPYCGVRIPSASAMKINGIVPAVTGVNPFQILDVPIGVMTYEIHASVTCPVGTCAGYGKGQISVKENGQFRVTWRNTTPSACVIELVPIDY